MSGVTLWRERPSSEARDVPLVLTRILLAPEAFEDAVALYEDLLGVRCDLRFAYPEMELFLASIGNVLLIAGREEALEPFRATDATFLVSALEPYAGRVRAAGGEVLEPPKDVPTGRNMLVRHPDGALVEYVEHRPQPGE
jgi:predicted enzyme related to lactoylglutathione lyase